MRKNSKGHIILREVFSALLSFAIALSSEVMEIMIASGPMQGSSCVLIGVMSVVVLFTLGYSIYEIAI